MLAIRGARAFDGERLIEGGVLVLTDADRIVAVEPASVSLPDAWPVADFSDSTVLPGLIDTHVHLCADSRDGALDRIAGYDDAALGQVIALGLRRQLTAGVTTVRDLGDRGYAALGWRQSVQEGAAPFPGPTILASGPPLTSRRGHCAGTWVGRRKVSTGSGSPSPNELATRWTSSRSWPAAASTPPAPM
jgi:imidazolonepropionase-like amidohydrolase